MEIEWLSIRHINPPYMATNHFKINRLYKSMDESGWKGRPLVVVPFGGGYQALNGSHRLEAAWSLYTSFLILQEIEDDAFPAVIPAIVLDSDNYYFSIKLEFGTNNPLCVLSLKKTELAEFLRNIGEEEAAEVIRNEEEE